MVTSFLIKFPKCLLIEMHVRLLNARSDEMDQIEKLGDTSNIAKCFSISPPCRRARRELEKKNYMVYELINLSHSIVPSFEGLECLKLQVVLTLGCAT